MLYNIRTLFTVRKRRVKGMIFLNLGKETSKCRKQT